jgi:4-carboxymuconolactone decarboxylase
LLPLSSLKYQCPNRITSGASGITRLGRNPKSPPSGDAPGQRWAYLRRIAPDTEIGSEIRAILAGLSGSRPDALEQDVGLGEPSEGATELDPRTCALVRIATLIALDAPPASYGRQVSRALDAGATPADILAVLRVVGTDVGGARVVAAAPEIMLALGIEFPATPDPGSGSDRP